MKKTGLKDDLIEINLDDVDSDQEEFISLKSSTEQDQKSANENKNEIRNANKLASDDSDKFTEDDIVEVPVDWPIIDLTDSDDTNMDAPTSSDGRAITTQSKANKNKAINQGVAKKSRPISLTKKKNQNLKTTKIKTFYLRDLNKKKNLDNFANKENFTSNQSNDGNMTATISDSTPAEENDAEMNLPDNNDNDDGDEIVELLQFTVENNNEPLTVDECTEIVNKYIKLVSSEKQAKEK